MSKIKPQGVVQSTPQVKMFGKIVDSLYAELAMVTSSSSVATVSRRIQVAKALQEVLDNSKGDMFAWVDVTVPEFYLQGMEHTLEASMLADSIVKITPDFVKINKKAINALLTNAYSQTDAILSSAGKLSSSVIGQATQEALLQEIAKKRITGATERELVKKMETIIKDSGLKKVTTGSGRQYEPKSYAKMVSRTILTGAQVDGTANQMAMNGDDLVIVSDHFGESDLCRPWENEILSVNGMYPGYTSLSDAKAGGLFHPNCRHVIDPYHDELLTESKVWDAKSQSYKDLKDVEPQNHERLVNQSAKDKLKAFDEYTTKIGLKDYHTINKSLFKGDKQEAIQIAKKQPKELKDKIMRLVKYI